MPTIKYKNKDGKRIQGATTLMGNNVGWGKGGLMYWANQQGLEGKTLQESKIEATEPGIIAHYLIECDLTESVLDLSRNSQEDIDKAEVSYLEYLTWREQFEFKPVAVEPHLVSEIWQYGTTPDVIGHTKNGLSVIDWKTGKIYANTFGQLIAGKVAWEEEHPDMPITGGFHVLRIPKDEDVPSFHHSFWGTLPAEAWGTFLCALRLNAYEKILKKLL